MSRSPASCVPYLSSKIGIPAHHRGIAIGRSGGRGGVWLSLTPCHQRRCDAFGAKPPMSSKVKGHQIALFELGACGPFPFLAHCCWDVNLETMASSLDAFGWLKCLSNGKWDAYRLEERPCMCNVSWGETRLTMCFVGTAGIFGSVMSRMHALRVKSLPIIMDELPLLPRYKWCNTVCVALKCNGACTGRVMQLISFILHGGILAVALGSHECICFETIKNTSSNHFLGPSTGTINRDACAAA